jgi:hypothetical protein
MIMENFKRKLERTMDAIRDLAHMVEYDANIEEWLFETMDIDEDDMKFNILALIEREFKEEYCDELENLSYEELSKRFTENELIEYYLSYYCDEEINDIGKELGCDYTETTWKEAKVMIIEDYVDALKKGIIKG